MARSMILIQQELLSKVYEEHKLGVNFCLLIRNHKLPMTPPTITKLVNHYSAMMDTTNDELREVIRASLFPVWLNETIKYQDTARWVYRGSMPTGHWELRHDS